MGNIAYLWHHKTGRLVLVVILTALAGLIIDSASWAYCLAAYDVAAQEGIVFLVLGVGMLAGQLALSAWWRSVVRGHATGPQDAANRLPVVSRDLHEVPLTDAGPAALEAIAATAARRIP